MFSQRFALLSRPLCEKFWSPFNRKLVGCELATYAVSEMLTQVVDQRHFSCSWNGQFGNSKLIEDFFAVLVSGFDIGGVIIDEGGWTQTTCKGSIHLHHTRDFLGWKPTHSSFFVPFRMRVEAIPKESNSRIAHLSFQCDLKQELLHSGCPQPIADLLGKKDALKIIVGDRDKPVITYNALFGNGRRPQEAECSSLA
jgi:hypothetical protein